MAYEKPFSHVSDMKGIAVDLPFCRFRYVKIVNDSKKNIQTENAAYMPSAENTRDISNEPIRIEYAAPAQTTTLGIDPMVSFASVIHELSYGRIDGYTAGPNENSAYPVVKEEVLHDLDIVV